MRRRTRYLLILIGFVFFLITAPLIVLYVGGITYDFSQNRYVKTGILIAETDPENARLLVDDLLEGTTPEKVKFLKPGEHTVTLTKEGYHPWTKRLEIKSAKTTWISVNVDAVHLLKTDMSPKTLARGIVDFDFTHDGILYLTPTQLVLTDEDGANQELFDIPKQVDRLELSEDKQMALLKGSQAMIVFDLGKKESFDISELTLGYQELLFSNDNQLIGVQDRRLYRIDWQANQSTLLGEHITAFASADTDWYVLQSNDRGTQDLKVFARTKSLETAQVLAGDLRVFAHNELLVTKTKELFILADNGVYKLNTQLNHLVDGVTDWHYDQNAHSLLLISPTELNRYDFGSGSVELISRSGNPFSAPLLAPQIGYAFYAQDSQLHALELDRRDVQNNYKLLDLPEVKKILTTANARYLYIQNSDQLTKLTIRD